MARYDALKLENQLCFSLYAASKEVVRRCKPFLDELNLTYTQYLCMVVLWERRSVNVRDLGRALYLDSGIHALLHKLESKGYVMRSWTARDGRELVATPTIEVLMLRDRALSVPGVMAACIPLSSADVGEFSCMLDEIFVQL